MLIDAGVLTSGVESLGPWGAALARRVIRNIVS